MTATTHKATNWRTYTHTTLQFLLKVVALRMPSKDGLSAEGGMIHRMQQANVPRSMRTHSVATVDFLAVLYERSSTSLTSTAFTSLYKGLKMLVASSLYMHAGACSWGMQLCKCVT